MIGDGENHLKCCQQALDTEVKDILKYCEYTAYSKIFPAMDIYINTEDKNVKMHMIDHLEKYQDFPEVQKFFKEYNIKVIRGDKKK